MAPGLSGAKEDSGAHFSHYRLKISRFLPLHHPPFCCPFGPVLANPTPGAKRSKKMQKKY
jgi:hypothetical protein